MEISMELKTCGCGRSPTGRCQGWHSLKQAEYLAKLDEFIQALLKFQNKQIEESSGNDES
jgi:hypothetical protein